MNQQDSPTLRTPEITFGAFAALARKRGWTLDDLTDRFRGRIDNPREFFGRVLQGQHADAVITFNSVIAFYQQERGFLRVVEPNGRTCRCGCGAAVFDRKRWATAACRKRTQRHSHRLPEKVALSA